MPCVRDRRICTSGSSVSFVCILRTVCLQTDLFKAAFGFFGIRRDLRLDFRQSIRKGSSSCARGCRMDLFHSRKMIGAREIDTKL